MNELYARVSEITKQALYTFMKEEEVSTLSYQFRYYFNHCIRKNQIQIISHHFSNHKIEGLTVIDALGTSFSYEIDNPVSKRHFTLCHELGHFILKHNGSYFTESVDNQESTLEREANVFAAIVLMPDIVLLSKIYYSCDDFQKVKKDLEVSRQALYFRLIDLLRFYQVDIDSVIKQAIEDYLDGQNVTVHQYFHQIKEDIIEEFNQYQPSLVARIRKKLTQSSIVTSQALPELLDRSNWNEIRKSGYLKVWIVYNKGKTLAYAWNSEELSEIEARKKAELELLIM